MRGGFAFQEMQDLCPKKYFFRPSVAPHPGGARSACVRSVSWRWLGCTIGTRKTHAAADPLKARRDPKFEFFLFCVFLLRVLGVAALEAKSDSEIKMPGLAGLSVGVLDGAPES